jgi:molybdate transport system permease protein
VTATAPHEIYTLTQSPEGDAAALRLALFSVALSLAALAVSERLVRRATRGRHA